MTPAMTWWQAVILGVVEGVTEYLPVSSTGHLILASALLGLDGEEIKRSIDAFNIIVQGGAILAVAGLYWRRVKQMLMGLMGRDDAGRRLFVHIVIAFLPAACIGLALAPTIERYLFYPGPVIAALFLGGVWMIWLGKGTRHAAPIEPGTDEPGGRRQITIDEMSWRTALGVGCFQVVAMWPGTSRSMMTIAGGTLLGLKPKEAAEFSFLLGLPTLGGACVYKLSKNLYESRQAGEPNFVETLGVTPVLIGMAVATLSAAVAIRWLISFLARHGLAAFGWYRICLALVMGALVLAGVVRLAP